MSGLDRLDVPASLTPFFASSLEFFEQGHHEVIGPLTQITCEQNLVQDKVRLFSLEIRLNLRSSLTRGLLNRMNVWLGCVGERAHPFSR